MPWGGELLPRWTAAISGAWAISPVPLPGATVRLRALAHGLRRVACPWAADEAARRFAHQPNVAQVLDMLAGRRRPPTTSLGRCFDAPPPACWACARR